MILIVEKAILQDAKIVPARDGYPAKTQCTVITSKSTFYLSSEVYDLSVLPVLEPVKLEVQVSRFGGGKNFFVVNTDMLTCNPIASKK